jgi:hypothetical protein
MTDPSTETRRWAERFKGALWLALILFALAGLMVVGTIRSWVLTFDLENERVGVCTP